MTQIAVALLLAAAVLRCCGAAVLLLRDAGARDYLTDSTLDVETTPEGPKLLVLA